MKIPGEQMKRTHRNIILILFSLLMLTITFFIGDNTITIKKFLYNSLFSISFVILTLVLIDLIWCLFGGDPLSKILIQMRSAVELLSDSMNSGLIRFYDISGNIGSHGYWLDFINKANKELYICGYTLLVCSKSSNFDQAILALAQKGVNIKIMIMSHGNKYFEALINTSQIKSLNIEVVKNEIFTMEKYFSDIIERFSKISNAKGKIDFLKINHGLLTSQIVKVDDEMLITPYLYSINTSESPTMLAKGLDKQLFATYNKEFLSLWNLNKK